LAAFVDRLGGIVVDVDTNVVRKNGNKPPVVVVPRGASQRLDGAAAVAYATYPAGGDLQQLPRLQEVLDGVLAKLSDVSVAAAALEKTGAGTQSTLPTPRLAPILTGLAADARAEHVDYRSLDVTPIETGGQEAYSLDRENVRAFVQRTLADSIPAGLLSSGNSVLVKNGVGTPELGRSTRDKLNKAGFVYVDGHNVPGFTFRNRDSNVVIYSTKAEAREQALQIAKALGLPETSLRLASDAQSLADFLVVLGQDYKS
jgi:anionic cell wall polymer biosynthesis LytR-Cps2A-Psr (LCP) family protein